MIELEIGNCIENQLQVVAALDALSRGESIVVFRASDSRASDAEDWYRVLTEGCRWRSDPRHMDYQLRLKKSTWWEITNDPNRADVYTYSETAQPLHTDNAWFQDPAEVNVFLMRRQARSGGEQTLLTVERLVEVLTSRDPVLLHDLCSETVRIAKGSGIEPNVTKILRLEPVLKISWNYYRVLRDSEAVTVLCDRFFQFLRELELEGLVETLRLRDGDVLAMRDDRVLHGRKSFETSSPGERVLLQSMWRTS